MKKWIGILGLLIMSIAFGAATNGKGTEFSSAGWGPTTKMAKQNNKPIFVFCRTYTCMVSKRMDDVFKDPAVAQFMNENFVCIEQNVDNTMENLRANNWGIQGVPTFVFLDSHKDKVFMSHGYHDPAAFLRDAEKALKAAGITNYKKPTIKAQQDNGQEIIVDDADDTDDGE